MSEPEIHRGIPWPLTNRSDDGDFDAILGIRQVLHASPESRIQALRECQDGKSVLWVSGGPGESEWEFKETIKRIGDVITQVERVAMKLVGQSEHWCVMGGAMREIRHSSGGRVVFWYRMWDDARVDARLRGQTFDVKVVG